MQNSSSSRRARPARGIVVLTVAVAGIVAGAGCSGGGSDATTATTAGSQPGTTAPTVSSSPASMTTSPTSTTIATTTVPPAAITLSPPTVASAVTITPSGEIPTLDQPVLDAVLAAYGAFVQDAIVGPLATGGPATLAALTDDAKATLTPEARAALTSEGTLPAAGGAALTGAQSLTIGALAGPDGAVSVVTVAVDLALEGTASGTAIAFTRTGDLTFIQEAGAWKVDSFSFGSKAAA